MTAVDAPTAEQQEAEDAVRRVLADFTVPTAHVAAVAGYAVLTRPFVAAALAARAEHAQLRATIDALRVRHRPVPIREDRPDHLVCAADRKAWPCDDGAILYEVQR